MSIEQRLEQRVSMVLRSCLYFPGLPVLRISIRLCIRTAPAPTHILQSNGHNDKRHFHLRASDVLKKILLQVHGIDDLKAAAQSCKAFYATLFVFPSILAQVFENEVPRPVLPHAYALYKCRKEGVATASDEEKRHILDKIYSGTADFGAFFPGSRLTSTSASDIRAFHNLVDRFTHRACNSAFRRISFKARKKWATERLRNYRYDHPPVSKAETLRFYFAFYRSELYYRLFSITHGSKFNAAMEADFFRRLTPWECEQCINVSGWLSCKIWPGELGLVTQLVPSFILTTGVATLRVITKRGYPPAYEPYIRLGQSEYPVRSPPMSLVSTSLPTFKTY